MTEYSLKMEHDEARRDGAEIVTNSGRGIHKCDALLDDFGIDYKHTQKSFTLSRAVWAKITKDAFSRRRLPTLKIVFWGNGEQPLRLWVISDNEMRDYLRLLKKEKEHEEGSTG